jgi:transposase-like protein
MKRSRKHYDLEYKRQIVSEYVSGKSTADQIAQREGLARGQIYKWRVQLDQYQREARIETIAQSEGVSIDQARRIRELEEELAATQQKLAQSVLENDLLKKTLPSSLFASVSSGYVDTKRLLARSKGRAK